jgi:AraC-like DNA-binding protein
MKIISVLAGEITPPNNELPVTTVLSHSLTVQTNDYNTTKVSFPDYSLLRIETAINFNDTLTFIRDNSALCLLYVQKNSFQLKIPGIGELVLHENSFIIFFVPVLYLECSLKNQNKYSLLLLLFPSNWLQNSPGILLSDFMQAIEKSRPAKLSKHAIIADNTILSVITDIINPSGHTLNTPCKNLVRAAIEKTEADKDKRYNEVTMKDALRMYNVKNYIENNICNENLTIPNIASATETDRNVIIANFTNIYGKTVHEYISDKRMGIAKILLLNPDSKIIDIALSLGLDQTTFNRQFKKRYHLSPKQYRIRQNG